LEYCGANLWFHCAYNGQNRFVAGIPMLTESNARSVVGALAVALQASLLLRRSDACVAEAFCASRLASETVGSTRSDYGTLPDHVDLDFILDRGVPM